MKFLRVMLAAALCAAALAGCGSSGNSGSSGKVVLDWTK